MKFILILSLTLFSFNLYSQVTQEWVRSYDSQGSFSDLPEKMAVDINGNVSIVGYENFSNPRAVVVRYNTSGTLQWSKTYSLGEESKFLDVIVDNLGYTYVTGFADTLETGEDFITIKYSPAGSIEWLARYNGTYSAHDISHSIANDSHGNIYITGFADDFNGLNKSLCTIKYDSTGLLQWVKYYSRGINQYDHTTDLVVDDSSNVYVTGYISRTNENKNLVTIKYDSDGNLLWERPLYFNFDQDLKCFIEIDGEGNILTAGEDYNNFKISKYSPSGD